MQPSTARRSFTPGISSASSVATVAIAFEVTMAEASQSLTM
jgi:hypothetical protein